MTEPPDVLVGGLPQVQESHRQEQLAARRSASGSASPADGIAAALIPALLALGASRQGSAPASSGNNSSRSVSAEPLISSDLPDEARSAYPFISDFLSSLDAKYTGQESRNFARYEEKFRAEEFCRIDELAAPHIFSRGSEFYMSRIGMKEGAANIFFKVLKSELKRIRKARYTVGLEEA